MKSRLGSIALLPVLFAAGALMGCSSSSSTPMATSDAGNGGGDGGDGTGPDINGTGMACPPQAHETVGSLITLDVQWPTTLANAGCDTMMNPKCTGQIHIWLLAHYDIDPTTNKVTGTTETCSNVTPPIPLTKTGTQSEGLDPNGPAAVVQINFLPDVWTKIIGNAMKAATTTTGQIGGWNVGSSFRVDPTNSVYGLSASSKYSDPKTAWPDDTTSIPMGDLTDDDQDGHPGITGTPSTDMGFVLPATAALQTPPVFADKLYLILRTELGLYGKSSSCSDISGSVGVQLLNNHVIGCELAGDAGDCTNAYNSTGGGQAGFVDSNSTLYYGPGAKIPLSGLTPSFAPPGITGTFVAKVMSTDADGGSVACSDVLSAFPAK